MSTPTRTSGQIFRSVIKGKNIITPTVREYITVRDYEVELSQGSGFDGQPIFGVTVVNRVTRGRELELDNSFDNIKSARLYINELGLDTSRL